jgi:hypothetical protein
MEDGEWPGDGSAPAAALYFRVTRFCICRLPGLLWLFLRGGDGGFFDEL